MQQEETMAETPAEQAMPAESGIPQVAGDTVTTDHISPAGVIPDDSPAAAYLTSCGVKKENFNSLFKGWFS